MNERVGSSYWHTHMLTRRGILHPNEVIDYADRHSRATVMHQGRINPYKLGIELFRDIEERWNHGRFGADYEKCDDMEARAAWSKPTGLGVKRFSK